MMMCKVIEKIRVVENEIVYLLFREYGKFLYDVYGEIYVLLMWMEFVCNEVILVLWEEI